LGFSAMRFRTFLYYTWPAFFISAGIILFLLWSFNRVLHTATRGGDQDPQ
jgi:membrane protein DedA with SNARE-associated domain